MPEYLLGQVGTDPAYLAYLLIFGEAGDYRPVSATPVI
jgi:hypothetical protein